MKTELSSKYMHSIFATNKKPLLTQEHGNEQDSRKSCHAVKHDFQIRSYFILVVAHLHKDRRKQETNRYTQLKQKENDFYQITQP